MLSDLPRDLAEEVLIRLPVTCNRVVRSVCKQWNTLSKGRSFTKKHLAAVAARESMVAVLICRRVYLMSVNLDHKGGVDPYINRQGKLISSLDDDEVYISQVYHCDGLLLCVEEGQTRLIVCNPYCGQTTRSFEPINWLHTLEMIWYAIGYDESSSSRSKSSCRRRSYKILRFGESYRGYVRYELYYINSKDNSSTFPVTIFPDWYIKCYARGVSLKGNTYWFAQEDTTDGALRHISEVPDFLICFDFTTEAFGPRLTLPFHSNSEDTVALSSVRDEQLAVLYQCHDTLRMEIWITTKIAPQVASWSKLFLEVNMEPLIGDQFDSAGASFFLDEEKKVAMVLDLWGDMDRVAYIIGEDGYFKKVDLGEYSNLVEPPLMCSFVPSLVQIKPSGKRKRKPIIDCL